MNFWDDLVEEILLWLPPKEKIYLSTVNKQFNRCLTIVRQRQKTMRFDDFSDSKTSDIFKGPRARNVKLQNFSRLLKYFPRLECISFDEDFTDKRLSSYIMCSQIITELLKCSQLKEVKGVEYWWYMRPENKQTFIENYSSQWLSYKGTKSFHLADEVFANFTSLKSVKYSEYVPERIFKDLVSLSIQLNDQCKSLSMLEKCPKLEKLKLYTGTSSGEVLKNNEFLLILPKLQNLNYLKLELNVHKDQGSIARAFRQLASYGKLKTLRLKLEPIENMDEILDALEQFTSLISFEMKVEFGTAFTTHEHLRKWFPRISKNKKLQRLIIHSPILSETFFDDFHFPHLKSIDIRVKLSLNDRQLIAISGHAYLEKVCFYSPYPARKSISFCALKTVIDTCTSLKDFKFYSIDNYITNFEIIRKEAIRRQIKIWIVGQIEYDVNYFTIKQKII